jgi:beta-galactosidase
MLAGKSIAQPFVPSQMDKILYGVAYYWEYMPYERLEEDARMMKECGINVVRIAESTWSFIEPHDGEFRLDHLDRIMDVMHQNGIKVIVGTPTYAIPSWLVKKYPDILLTDKNGQKKYGSRQIMDITNKDYRFYAERVIRNLMEKVHEHPAVIGFQTDNETKHYGTEGGNVQELFKLHLMEKFETPEDMNKAFGFNYWSNSIYSWDDLPSTMGTINGSYRSEFEKFRRQLVSDFLAWQVSIVNEYKKPEQFVTQNFDLEWSGWGSHGIQSNVDHFEASQPFDIAGVDIYHPTAEFLDGMVIGLAGDLTRSMKNTNYLVVETQAQSIMSSGTQILPFPGQLRLQAFSHIASGANMVAYWPWHSIHNSFETYWKGLLSHDLEPNASYNEARQIASEFNSIGEHIVNLKKQNRVAIYFSNESLTALNSFPINSKLSYNDIVRKFYETLYKMNIECDFIDHTSTNINKYDVIVVPPLYTASDEELNRLIAYAENGGQIIFAFKSGFTNENVQVRSIRQPALIREACGMSYQQFTGLLFGPQALKQVAYNIDSAYRYSMYWAELLMPEGAEVLARYDHPYWKEYAAIVRNSFGRGRVTYLGTMPSDEILQKIFLEELNHAEIDIPKNRFPVIDRKGLNINGKNIHYIFNYSQKEQPFSYSYTNGINLLTGKKFRKKTEGLLKPWDFVVLSD